MNTEIKIDSLPEQHRGDALQARDGSLDAAARLHAGLLPGWWCELRVSTRPRAVIGEIDASHEAQDDVLARAWLAAILMACQT